MACAGRRCGVFLPCATGDAGAALVVALVLLLVLTALGVAAMSTATYEAAMAGNAQLERAAFDAAEAGIEIALARPELSTSAPVSLPSTPLAYGNTQTETVVAFLATTAVPDAAFSSGTAAGALQAFHFEIAATGRAPRNAVALHRQGFYVIGPAGP